MTDLWNQLTTQQRLIVNINENLFPMCQKTKLKNDYIDQKTFFFLFHGTNHFYGNFMVNSDSNWKLWKLRLNINNIKNSFDLFFRKVFRMMLNMKFSPTKNSVNFFQFFFFFDQSEKMFNLEGYNLTQSLFNMFISMLLIGG